VKSCLIDIITAVLLLACGILNVWNGFASLQYLWFFHNTKISEIAPFIFLGSVAAIAAVGVFFWRKAAGIIGSISMLALAVLFFPSAHDSIILFFGNDTSIWVAPYIAPTVLLVTALLVCWRFVLAPRGI
jgi:hypothetical protein